MRVILILFLVTSIFGCAQTMTIPNAKLSENQATLTIDASALEGYVSIPLINSKVVNVYLSEFPECVGGKPKMSKSKKLGKATLTPKKNTQTVVIPSGMKLLVSTNSHENSGGYTYTCWNSVHFKPDLNQNYVIKVTPHKSFGTQACTTILLQSNGKENIAVESAIYPQVEYKGFWKGEQFNHCDAKLKGV